MTQGAITLWRMGRRPLFWAALLFSYASAIMPGKEAPSLGGSDKTDHVVAFLVLSVLVVLAYPARSRVVLAVALSLYGILIELSQATSFIGRDASVADWIADSIAIVVGMVATLVAARFFPAPFALDAAKVQTGQVNELQALRQSFPQGEFERLAVAAGFDPDDLWVGGYADYEWRHLRLLLEAYSLSPGGTRVLEFGCNVGGSSVVLAALGADVTGVDIDPKAVALTSANLARHGLSANIIQVENDGLLPLASNSIDFVLANSVLEYVETHLLDSVISEIHRVLRPGGKLLVCGTASRIALKERHSHRWLINYVPKAFDRLAGRPLQRGLSPIRLARLTRGLFVDATGQGWCRGRQMIHGRMWLSARLLALVGRLFHRSPGWMTPYIEVLLRKV